MNELFRNGKTCRLLLAMGLFAFMSMQMAGAQGRAPVSGRVTDASTAMPLLGVTVTVEGTNTGAVTDGDGAFTLNAASGDVLMFNYIGYKTRQVPLTGQGSVDVAMEPDAYGIDDVVVIGYGTTTKKELTGSVTSLRQEDFNQGSFTSPAGLLQGKVAGLTIVSPQGGDPNGSYELLLRGTNTLMSDQGPLVIIDGVPGADMRNINFQEVESIDVLKDGSAAAIYGTRGTNGVVIITTKRARAGTTQVDYDGQVSFETIARMVEPMNASQFADAVNRVFDPADASRYLHGADTDWFKAITRTPISHKHNLAVSGGSESFSHRTVANVEQNQGLQRGNDAAKYLFKTNINQKILQGWVDLDYNAYISKRKYTPSMTDAFRQAFIHNPTEPIYDEGNADTGGYSAPASGTMDYYNPVAMLNERDAESVADDYGVNVRATLNVLPVSGLKWDNFFSYDQQRFENRTYRSFYYPSLLGSGGSAEISNEMTNKLIWESTLNYSAQIGRHSLQALLGYTYQEGMSQSSSMTNGGFDSDYWQTNNMGSGSNLRDGMAGMSSYRGSYKYISFFGRFMYNYNEKYLASVSLRRDGSSRFGANHKWGWFPAVSAGWRINREGFMQDVKWVDELKLRAGFGVTGNQDFDNYKSMLLMATGNNYFYNEGKWIGIYEPASNANPDLRWEKKSEWNVGLDFSLFGGRLNGTVDYYQRTTRDLLYNYNVNVPPYDYDVLFTNLGTIKNSGIEVTLSGSPVYGENFKWNTAVTFSHNTNKLMSLTDEQFQNAEMRVGWLNTPMGVYCQRLVEGESLGTFYGPRWEGVDAEGNDIVPDADSQDLWQNLGTAYPDFVLGWSNTFTYKNLDLNIMMRASIGGKVFNRYRADYGSVTGLGLRNILASWLDDPEFTGPPVYSSKYLEDASYLKVDNISLGYNFKFDSKFVSGLRIYVSGQNLLCITKYKGVDPEVSLMGLSPGIENTSYYPRTSIFTLGVNLKF